MASMEAKTRAFLESQGHAWPAAPDPLLLLDGPLRRCSEVLGRVVVEPDYFHTVAHVKVLADEVRKLERADVTATFKYLHVAVQSVVPYATGPVGSRVQLNLAAGVKAGPLTGSEMHIRAIVERPKRNAVSFNVAWRRSFGHNWPYAADKAIHPWLQTAYDVQMHFYDKWRLPAGTHNVNWWNLHIADAVMKNYTGDQDLIAPITPINQRIYRRSGAFTPDANRAWWEQHRQEFEGFVPPQCLAISCLLGRSAIAPDWGRGKVGSIMLLDNEVEVTWTVLYSIHGGVIGFLDGDMNDLETPYGIVRTVSYTVSLLDMTMADTIERPFRYIIARYIIDRTPDKEFLTNWRRTHGRVWPEPHEALPPIVQAKIVEYFQIMSMAWDNFGQAIDARFDDLLVPHTDRLATMGVTYDDLDDLNRRACRRKAPVVARGSAPPQAARGPALRMPEPVVEAKVSEIDKQIAEANRELSEQKKREKRQGMVPALVQPAVPERAQAVHAPVESVNNKAHRKKTKQGQQAAAAASKAAEQAQEQTRAFLKETAPAFREDIAAVAAEPSAQHLEREAARARHAQEAGDRRAAKAIVREDAERRVAEAFGL
jgi:hypothetical protein